MRNNIKELCFLDIVIKIHFIHQLYNFGCYLLIIGFFNNIYFIILFNSIFNIHTLPSQKTLTLKIVHYAPLFFSVVFIRILNTRMIINCIHMIINCNCVHFIAIVETSKLQE